MIRAAFLALGDLGDRRVLAILLRSLCISLLIFVAAGALLGWLLAGADPCGWFGDGACPLGAAGGGIGALVLTLAGLWLLFPAIALGVVSACMDGIVAAVEARHYPQAAAAARPIGLARGALLGLRSGLRLLVYNLIALPLYLLLLITGIGTIAAFVAVNGVALGHDLGEMVAARHGTPASRKAWLRATRGNRALIGAAASALFLVPLLNLLAPILAAAMTTHLHNSADAPGPPEKSLW